MKKKLSEAEEMTRQAKIRIGMMADSVTGKEPPTLSKMEKNEVIELIKGKLEYTNGWWISEEAYHAHCEEIAEPIIAQLKAKEEEIAKLKEYIEERILKLEAESKKRPKFKKYYEGAVHELKNVLKWVR